jgi:hypothetical protein
MRGRWAIKPVRDPVFFEFLILDRNLSFLLPQLGHGTCNLKILAETT